MCSVEIAGRTKMKRLWKYVAVQDLARHRVEERLGALGLPVVDQQADEVRA